MEDIIKLFTNKFQLIENNKNRQQQQNNNYNNNLKKKNNNDIRNNCFQLIESLSNNLNKNNDFQNSCKSSEIIQLFNLVKLLPFIENENDYDEDDDNNYLLYNTIRKETIELIFKTLPNILKQQSFQYDCSLMTTLFSVVENGQSNSLRLLVSQHTYSTIHTFKLSESNLLFIRCLQPYLHDIFQYIVISLKDENLKIIISILELLELVITCLGESNESTILTYLPKLFNMLFEFITIDINGNQEYIYGQIINETNEKYQIRNKSCKILKTLSNSSKFTLQIINELISISNSESIEIQESILQCLNTIGTFSPICNESSLKLMFDNFISNVNGNNEIQWIYTSTLLNSISTYCNCNSYIGSIEQLTNISNTNIIFQISFNKFISLLIINKYQIPTSVILEKFIKLLNNTHSYKYSTQFNSIIQLCELIFKNIKIEKKQFKIIIDSISNQYSNGNGNGKQYKYLELFKIIIVYLQNDQTYYSQLPIDIFNSTCLELNGLIGEYEDFMNVKYIQPINQCLEFLIDVIVLIPLIISNVDSSFDFQFNSVLLKCINIIKPFDIISKSLSLLAEKLKINFDLVPELNNSQLNTLLQTLYKFVINSKQSYSITFNSYKVLSNLLDTKYIIQIQPYIDELLLQITNYFKTIVNTSIDGNLKYIISITISKLLLNSINYNINNFKSFSNVIDYWCGYIGIDEHQSIILILDIILNDPILISFTNSQSINLKSTLLKYSNSSESILLKLMQYQKDSDNNNSLNPIVSDKLKKLINTKLNFL